jgi:hypothetical protein
MEAERLVPKAWCDHVLQPNGTAASGAAPRLVTPTAAS